MSRRVRVVPLDGSGLPDGDAFDAVLSWRQFSYESTVGGPPAVVFDGARLDVDAGDVSGFVAAVSCVYGTDRVRVVLDDDGQPVGMEVNW